MFGLGVSAMDLYLVRMSHPETGENFVKIGVSTDASKRFAFGATLVRDAKISLKEKAERSFRREKFVSDHPYEVETLKVVQFMYEGDAYMRERELLDVMKPWQHWPAEKFSGVSECFKPDKDQLANIVAWMVAAAAEAKAGAPDPLRYKFAALKVRAEDPIQRHRMVLEEIERLWPSPPK